MFSVIVPLYNKGPYLKRCLESVLGQTYEDFEVVVVDDCSSDSGLELAGKILGASDRPFQLVQRSSRGGSCAPPRATGVRHANGKFVAFLDADDEWKESVLLEMSTLIDRFPSADAFAIDRELHVDGRIELGPYGQKSDVKKAHIIDLDRYLLARRYFGNPFRVQGMAFRPESLDDVGGFVHAPRSSDIDLMFRFFLSGKLAAWSPYRGLVIHRVPGSTMANTTTQFTRPWFYSVTAFLDRDVLPQNVAKSLRREMSAQKMGDLVEAVRLQKLTTGYLRNLHLVRNFVFSAAVWVLVVIPVMQGVVAATLLKALKKRVLRFNGA